MSESQSRYGIMESLNQKKLDTKERLEVLKRDKATREINHNGNIHQIDNEITNANNNYKNNHANWKTNKQLEITLKEQEVRQTLEKMKQEIVGKDATYIQEHNDFINGRKKVKTDQERDWENFTKLRDMEIDAIAEKIKEIDGAIKSLKDMSKESTERK